MSETQLTLTQAEREFSRSVNESLRLEGDILKLRREQRKSDARAKELRLEIRQLARAR